MSAYETMISGLPAATPWWPLAVELATKGTLVLMAALLAAVLLRGRSAAFRHLVWSVGLAAVVLLPAASVVLPRLEVLPVGGGERLAVWRDGAAGAPERTRAGVGEFAAGPEVGAALSGGGVVRTGDGLAGGSDPVGGDELAGDGLAGGGLLAGGDDLAGGDEAAGSEAPAAAEASLGAEKAFAAEDDSPVDGRLAAAAAGGPGGEVEGGRAGAVTAGGRASDAVAVNQAAEAGAAGRVSAFLAVWAVGAAALLIHMLLGGLALRRIARRARVLDGPDWTTPLYEAADRLELTDAPRLLRSADVALPFTYGLLRPRVVLPASSDDWNDERRRAVLFHELGHVRRLDLLSHLIGRLACALYWFHPLVWFAARRARAECERACDDLVLAAGTRASVYADHLLHIVSAAARRRAPAVAIPMAQRKEFEGRMLAILEPNARRDGPSRGQAFGIAASVAALSLAVAAAAPAGGVESLDGSPAVRDEVTADGVNGPSREVPGGDGSVAAVGPEADGDAGAVEAGDVADWLNGAADLMRAVVTADTDTVAVTRIIQGDTISRAGRTVVLGRRGGHVYVDSGRVVHVSPDWDFEYLEGLEVLGDIDLGDIDLGDLDLGGIEHVEWGHRMPSAIAIPAPMPMPAPTPMPMAVARPGDVWEYVPDDVHVYSGAFGFGGRSKGEPADSAVVAALVGALSDPVASVRASVAHALGELGDARAVPALAAVVRDDTDRDTRRMAAWALGEIEDTAAVAALGAAARDEDAGVAAMAIWALGEIGDAAAAPHLAGALESPHADVRRRAAWALGEIDDASAVPALVAALRDADDEVAEMAAWALAELGDPRATAGLAAALAGERAGDGLRQKAAWALGELESDRAPAALTAALRDESAEVRKMAAWALGEIGDPSTTAALVTALDDESADVRRTAFWALGEIGGEPARAALLEAIKSSDPEIRRMAARALARIY